MMPSAPARMPIAFPSFGVTSWEVSAVVMSAAISRSSSTLTVTSCPWLAASAATRCAAWSASSRVDEGSLVPALTTTRLKVSMVSSCIG